MNRTMLWLIPWQPRLWKMLFMSMMVLLMLIQFKKPFNYRMSSKFFSVRVVFYYGNGIPVSLMYFNRFLLSFMINSQSVNPTTRSNEV